MMEIKFSFENIKHASKTADKECFVKLPHSPNNKEINEFYKTLAYLTQVKVKFTVLHNSNDDYILVLNR